MDDPTIRFGVRTESAASSTFRVWSNAGEDDVYIVSRKVGVPFKASLHQTGKSHFKLTVPGNPNEVISEERWTRPPSVNGVTRRFALVIPWAALKPAERWTQKVRWYPLPDDAVGAEFSVVFTAPGIAVPDHPGAHSLGTSLVGRYVVPLSGETVWVVVVPLAELPRVTFPGRGQMRLLGDRDEARVREDLRSAGSNLMALVAGTDENGCGWFIDAPATHAWPDEAPQDPAHLSDDSSA